MTEKVHMSEIYRYDEAVEIIKMRSCKVSTMQQDR